MPVAEKALPTIQKNHSGDLFIRAHDRNGHRVQIFGWVSQNMRKTLFRDYEIEVEDDSYVDATRTQWYAESQERLRCGSLICILRKNSTMSQGDLGKRLDVTSKYVSDLEHGRRPVSVNMAKKLAVVFDRKAERFLPL